MGGDDFRVCLYFTLSTAGFELWACVQQRPMTDSTTDLPEFWGHGCTQVIHWPFRQLHKPAFLHTVHTQTRKLRHMSLPFVHLTTLPWFWHPHVCMSCFLSAPLKGHNQQEDIFPKWIVIKMPQDLPIVQPLSVFLPLIKRQGFQ